MQVELASQSLGNDFGPVDSIREDSVRGVPAVADVLGVC
ncbi:unnamed protein product [Acidithrix sp. C25]|nr:unnamed protein product [Acidithrix sp. C25]